MVKQKKKAPCLMTGFKGRKIPQAPYELQTFLDLMNKHNVRRYLEIGLRHATSFHWLGERLPAECYMVGVDMPGAMWGDREGNGKAYIKEACEDLVRVHNQTVNLVFGDSRSTVVINEVKQHAPFDMIFIDGDHRYANVKLDWQNYKDMGVMIAFHDIDADKAFWMTDQQRERYGVPKLWRELKETHPHIEIKDITNPGMGIGVLFQRDAP